METDVTVVGGGIMGLSTTYHLTKAGFKVLLIELDKIAAGASGSNAGMISKGDPSDPIDHLLYNGSYTLYQKWNSKRELGYDIELEEISVLRSFTDEHIKRMDYGHWKHRREVWEKAGLYLLKRSEWNIVEPNLSEEVTWGIETMRPMINIFKVCQGLASTAKRNGATILTSTKLKDIEIGNGRVRKVKTDRGEIKTEYVVNAAGAWASKIGEMVGITIPVLPAIGTALVTEPTPPLTGHLRILFEPTWFDPHQPFIMNSPDPAQRLGITTEIDRHSKEHNYLLARSEHIVSLPQKGAKLHPEPETIKCIADGAIKLVPKLQDLHIIRVYAGMRPLCEVDGKPILGEVKSVEGFILAAAPWHTGMSYGPMCGKLVSEIIEGKATSIPIDTLRFSRFVETKHFPYVHLFRYN